MPDEKKSFRELLGDAPAASDTISLVGTLSRSHEAGKFVITLADGRSMALNIDAVKEHTVLAGSVGQILVRIEVDSKSVPAEAALERAGLKSLWEDRTLPWNDIKRPILDTYPGYWPDITVPNFDQMVAGPGPVPPGGDPWATGTTGVPFALATPHHAPPGMIGAMQAWATPGNLTGPFTKPWIDFKRPWVDQKHPWEDGTYHGSPPQVDF
jgi:hypothetical protein